MTATFEQVVLAVVRGLERAGVDYAIVGGVAVIAWGDPRTTRDIDVIARLDPARLPRLAEELKPEGLAFDLEGARSALDEGTHFTVFHADGFYHVDLQPARKPNHLLTLQGRRRQRLHGQELWLASPEDTIANKLRFGSEQDVRDAVGIYVRAGPTLDQRLLAAHCAEFGLARELERFRRKVEDELRRRGAT